MSYTFEYKIILKYHIKGYSHLCFGDKKLINVKTGRIRKQCLNGEMIGYWLDSKTFKSIKWIKENLVKIKHEQIPF